MRKTYTDEFKAKVGLEALEGATAINEIASKYGVHPNMVADWKRKIQEGAAGLFSRKKDARIKDSEEIRDELFKEIGKLKVDNDFLKKKCFQMFGRDGR